MKSNQPLIYRNVMEVLVADEVDEQFQKLPPKLTTYLNKEEVIAFALNRLPALYATSEKGWQQQYNKGKQELKAQINAAVRHALVTVRHDPLRFADPLSPKVEELAEKALQKIKILLQRKDISWENLADAVEQVSAKWPSQVQMANQPPGHIEMWDKV